jgi:hypothetical protein
MNAGVNTSAGVRDHAQPTPRAAGCAGRFRNADVDQIATLAAQANARDVQRELLDGLALVRFQLVLDVADHRAVVQCVADRVARGRRCEIDVQRDVDDDVLRLCALAVGNADARPQQQAFDEQRVGHGAASGRAHPCRAPELRGS